MHARVTNLVLTSVLLTICARAAGANDGRAYSTATEPCTSIAGPASTVSDAPVGADIAVSGIHTTPSWDGSQSVCCFAYPDSATYGQTITAPPTGATLQSFTFYMNLPTSCTFQGEVYAWDGSKATGAALWEGPSTHTAGSGAFEAITFTPGGVVLAPGLQYVIFASLSKLTGSGGGSWGSILTDAYPGGDFVYINSGSDPSQWTTMPWTITWSSAKDLAFKAVFGTGFDLSFKDDLGRSSLCANSKTGDWQYTVLTGAGKGIYSGKGSVTKTADRVVVRSAAGLPRLMLLTYFPQMLRATASLGGSAFVSQLSDRNTRDDPASCTSF